MALPFAAGRSVKSAAEMARRLQGRASAAHLRRRAADRRSPAAYTTAPGRARVAGGGGERARWARKREQAALAAHWRQHWRRRSSAFCCSASDAQPAAHSRAGSASLGAEQGEGGLGDRIGAGPAGAKARHGATLAALGARMRASPAGRHARGSG